MKYTQAAGEKSTVNLKISFTDEEWHEALNKAYVKTRGKFSVPGFRKGKVPKPVIENYYGKSVFYDEALNLLCSENYRTIIEKEKDNFTEVGDPELSVESIEEGKGVVINAIVPVKPEVEIEKYTGLKIRKFEYNVTDADVEKEIERFAAKNAYFTEIKDRPCQKGDFTDIDFTGFLDGKRFEGGSAKNFSLELGSGSFIRGFEEGMEGMKTGEVREVNVKFPEDYQADELRGKDAVFAVRLNKITEKHIPEIDDAFVKAHAGCETVEEYKKKTRERLEKNAEDRGKDETEGNIFTEITKYTKAEIPQAMIEREIDKMVQDFSYSLLYRGLKIEDYLKYSNMEMSDLRKQYTTEARARVISQLIADKIIKTENIKAGQSEIDQKIEEQAKSLGKSFEEHKNSIDPGQLKFIENEIIIGKLFDFLEANNEMYTESEGEISPADGTAKPAKTEKAEKPAKTAAKSPAKTAAKPAEKDGEKPAAKPAAKRTAKTTKKED